MGRTLRMHTGQERRRFKRYGYKTPVEIRYENQGDVYMGTMSDYSNNGMCIKTEVEISHDRNIYIRMREYHPGKKGVNSYEWYSARVMWGKKDATGDIPFSLGVQFPQPILY